MILAIDTSGPICSAAFLDSGSNQIVTQRSDDIGRGHAELLLPMIDELMAASELQWSDVEAVGCSTGPGSFTGLRVGLAAAKGFAFALSCPCIGVSVFEAFNCGRTDPLCVVLNAKRNEFWLQIFDNTREELEDPKAVSHEHVLDFIPSNIADLVGSGAQDLASRDNRFRILSDAPSPPIEAIAQLTKNRIANAVQFPAQPLYLRAPDAKPQAEMVASI